MTIDEVITYIENQIAEVIGKMINARGKHLTAIEKMLDKMNSTMKEKTYLYRQGKTYDRVVKVERSDISQYDIEKPTIKLNYVGGKMSLKYDTETIEVPEIPIFTFEPVEDADLIYHLGAGQFEEFLYVLIPPGVSVEPAPDVENAFGKYYKLFRTTRVVGEQTINFSPERYLSFPGMLFKMTSFKYYEGYGYYREITIEGKTEWFDVGVYPGNAHGQFQAVDGSWVDGMLSGILFVATTQYEGDSFWVLYNNSFRKGVITDSVYQLMAIHISYREHSLMEEI